MTPLLRRIKTLVVKPGAKPRRILAGPFKGLTMNLDLANQTQLYIGLFEREVYSSLKRLSKDIKTAVDIGADQGEYSLFFLRKTSIQKLFTFEPSDVGTERLKESLVLNDIIDDPRLVFSSKFVGLQDTDTQCTLDSLSKDIDTPCLIKMDVDGAEVDILRGSANLLGREEVRWLIETHSVQLEIDCLKILEQAGYTTKVLPNAWWRVFAPEVRGTEQNRWLIAEKKRR